jgi:hypothetical protein
MRFIWDEGRDMLAVRNIIINHDITLFGPFNDIAGHKDFFGVFHYYLILPSLWLANFNPVGPAVFTALLGVAMVALTYYWMTQWQKQKTALAVSALLAFSPLVVRFNQWAWNPNTLGFFGISYLIGLQKARKSGSFIWIFFSGIFLGILFQLHYFSIALAAAFFVVLVERKQEWFLKLLLFSFGFLIPNLSFLIFDLTHEGFYQKIIFDSFFGSSQQKFFHFSLKDFFGGPLVYLFDVTDKFFASKILTIFFLPAFLLFLIKTFKNHKSHSEEKQIAFSWLSFLFLTAFFPSLLDDYHSGMLWITIAISSVFALKKIFKKYFLFPFILLLSWLFYANHFWREPTWQENMPQLQTAGHAISEDIKKQNTSQINIASFVDPETRGLRFRYFIIRENQKLLNYDEYPQSEILYAISPHSWEETRKNPAWELDTFRNLPATTIWQNANWNIYRIQKIK